LQWYGHVLRKDDNDLVKKCINLEVEGARQRGNPRKTWKELVDKYVDDLLIKLSDALHRCKWQRMIRGNWNDRSSDSEAQSLI